MATINRTASGIKYDTTVKEVSQKRTPMPTPTKSTGSGDAKIAALKSRSSSTSMPTPAEYNAKAEADKKAQQAATAQNNTPRILSGQVYEYPTPYSPAYIQRANMGALVAGLQPTATASQLRAQLIQSQTQQTVAYIPGQKTPEQRLREADRAEAVKDMKLGRFEPYAAAYEGKVGDALAPLTMSGYKSGRFIGGVAEGIALTPVAIPRLAKGIVTNPGATVRETVLGMSEQIITDPARGTGQLIGAAIAGKGIGKGAKITGDIAASTAKTMKPGIQAFAKSESASVNYWQVKYDFNKPRVNALESEVPQIQPGMGLVSGRQYTGLNPILEARIKAQGATTGVKSYADMTALERYQASKPVLDVPAVKPGNVPKITDPGKLNQLIAGERVSFADSPIMKPTGKPVFRGLPEIEPSKPGIVGIKRYSNKPLSEPPAGFLETNIRPGMRQSDVVFKPAPEASYAPQLQMAPKTAKPKPTTFKEPAPSTLTKGELARLQRLVNGEALPKVKTAPRTLAAVGLSMFAMPSVAQLTRTAAMTSPLTRTATQPATVSLTVPQVNTKALTRVSTASVTQPAASPLARSSTAPKTISAVSAPSVPRITIPPVLEYRTDEKKNRSRKTRTTRSAEFFDLKNPIRGASDVFGFGRLL